MKATVARRCHCGSLVHGYSFIEVACPSCGFKKPANGNPPKIGEFSMEETTLQAILGGSGDLDLDGSDHVGLGFQR